MVRHREVDMSTNTITIKRLERELSALKKKFFIYESRQAEKEILEGKVHGPFRSGKELLKNLKK